MQGICPPAQKVSRETFRAGFHSSAFQPSQRLSALTGLHSFDKIIEKERCSIELSLLYYFKTVAEQENITKAAELLYISQPALSKAIAKLEKSLDVTLFERRKGRISLSAMGRVYYEYVSSAFQVLETGEKKLEEIKQTSAETVSIASPVAGVLQELIYNFLLSGDLIQINQYFYEEHILESELLSGKLDFAVTPVTI